MIETNSTSCKLTREQPAIINSCSLCVYRMSNGAKIKGGNLEVNEVGLGNARLLLEIPYPCK